LNNAYLALKNILNISNSIKKKITGLLCIFVIRVGSKINTKALENGNLQATFRTRTCLNT
jgi:hypothetical protein